MCSCVESTTEKHESVAARKSLSFLEHESGIMDSFLHLIASAITSAPKGYMTLAEICDFLRKNIPSYEGKNNKVVKEFLHIQKSKGTFIHIPGKKDGFWSLHPLFAARFVETTTGDTKPGSHVTNELLNINENTQGNEKPSPLINNGTDEPGKLEENQSFSITTSHQKICPTVTDEFLNASEQTQGNEKHTSLTNNGTVRPCKVEETQSCSKISTKDTSQQKISPTLKDSNKGNCKKELLKCTVVLKKLTLMNEEFSEKAKINKTHELNLVSTKLLPEDCTDGWEGWAIPDPKLKKKVEQSLIHERLPKHKRTTVKSFGYKTHKNPIVKSLKKRKLQKNTKNSGLSMGLCSDKNHAPISNQVDGFLGFDFDLWTANWFGWDKPKTKNRDLMLKISQKNNLGEVLKECEEAVTRTLEAFENYNSEKTKLVKNKTEASSSSKERNSESLDDVIQHRLKDLMQKFEGSSDQPPLSNTVLAVLALMSTDKPCLPLAMIYHFIQEKFTYYHQSEFWKTPLEQALNLNSIFTKACHSSCQAKKMQDHDGCWKVDALIAAGILKRALESVKYKISEDASECCQSRKRSKTEVDTTKTSFKTVGNCGTRKKKTVLRKIIHIDVQHKKHVAAPDTSEEKAHHKEKDSTQHGNVGMTALNQTNKCQAVDSGSSSDTANDICIIDRNNDNLGISQEKCIKSTPGISPREGSCSALGSSEDHTGNTGVSLSQKETKQTNGHFELIVNFPTPHKLCQEKIKETSDISNQVTESSVSVQNEICKTMDNMKDSSVSSYLSRTSPKAVHISPCNISVSSNISHQDIHSSTEICTTLDNVKDSSVSSCLSRNDPKGVLISPCIISVSSSTSHQNTHSSTEICTTLDNVNNSSVSSCLSRNSPKGVHISPCNISVSSSISQQVTDSFTPNQDATSHTHNLSDNLFHSTCINQHELLKSTNSIAKCLNTFDTCLDLDEMRNSTGKRHYVTDAISSKNNNSPTYITTQKCWNSFNNPLDLDEMNIITKKSYDNTAIFSSKDNSLPSSITTEKCWNSFDTPDLNEMSQVIENQCYDHGASNSRDHNLPISTSLSQQEQLNRLNPTGKYRKPLNITFDMVEMRKIHSEKTSGDADLFNSKENNLSSSFSLIQNEPSGIPSYSVNSAFLSLSQNSLKRSYPSENCRNIFQSSDTKEMGKTVHSQKLSSSNSVCSSREGHIVLDDDSGGISETPVVNGFNQDAHRVNRAGSFVCHGCKRQFSCFFLFKTHNFCYAKEKIFACYKCHKVYTSSEVLCNHLVTEHTGEDNVHVVSELCYPSYHHYHNHDNFNTPVKKPRLEYALKYTESFKAFHDEMIPDFAYCCWYCRPAKHFQSEENYRHHLGSRHPEMHPNILICKKCGATFDQKEKLLKHKELFHSPNS